VVRDGQFVDERQCTREVARAVDKANGLQARFGRLVASGGRAAGIEGLAPHMFRHTLPATSPSTESLSMPTYVVIHPMSA
jgi:integrase